MSGDSLATPLPLALSSSSALKQQVTAAFDAYRDPLFRYLVRTLNNRDQAEDLTQEVFLRLHAHLHKGEAIGNVRAWIFRVAHNLAVDAQRRHTIMEPLDTSVLSQSAGAERELLKDERQVRLQAALAHLSDQEKRCLELRAEGLTYQQIAAVLEMRLPTVAKLISRTIEKLLREVADA